MAWNVGNRVKVRIGEDPWVGSGEEHILPEELRYLAQSSHFRNYHLVEQVSKLSIYLPAS